MNITKTINHHGIVYSNTKVYGGGGGRGRMTNDYGKNQSDYIQNLIVLKFF